MEHLSLNSLVILIVIDDVETNSSGWSSSSFWEDTTVFRSRRNDLAMRKEEEVSTVIVPICGILAADFAFIRCMTLMAVVVEMEQGLEILLNGTLKRRHS